METALGIALLAGLTFVLLLIKWAISATLHKGVDAASNAYKRAQERNNPPPAESLAERYGQSGPNGQNGDIF